MHVSSNFLDFLVGHHLSFLEPHRPCKIARGTLSISAWALTERDEKKLGISTEIAVSETVRDRPMDTRDH